MKTLDEDKKKSVCRICLQYGCENLIKGMSLYEKCNNMYVYEKVQFIANIVITEGDNLPDRICSKCLQALETAWNFKQLCEHSDNILHSHSSNLSERKPIKEEVSATEDPYIDDYDRNSPCVYQEQGDINEKDEKPLHTSVTKPGDLKIECHDCGNIFKSKCKFRVHWKKVHFLKQLICPYCKQQLKSYKAFNNHINKRSQTCLDASKFRVEGVGKSRIFYCLNCNGSFKRIHSLRSHVVTHTGERPFMCNICGKGFSQQGTLQGHMEGVHKQYMKEFTCEHCGKHLKGRQKWTRHMLRHRNIKFPCSICNKEYTSSGILKEHMKRHSGIKSYTCEMCAKTFCVASDLWNHKMKVHSKMPRYSCEDCEYKTSNFTLMARHRAKHNGTNKYCHVCGAFVEDQEQLALHQKRHFEKNLECGYCHKNFFVKKSLTSHIRLKHNSCAVKIEDKTDKR